MTARLPIRWRITLWYSAVLMATLLVFAGGLYVGLRVLLYENFQEQVAQQAALVVSGLDLSSGRPAVDAATMADFRDGERFLRVVAVDGGVVVDTAPAAGLRDDALRPVDPTSGRTDFAFVTTGSTRFGVATAPIVANGAVIGAVQVGITRGDIDEALRAVAVVLAVAAPLVLGAAVLGGYVVSRRALAPVVAITDMAGALQAHELGARLNLALPEDELGRLARTFDAMLGRIETAFERQRRFTGDAAHELRTPLSLMRTQVDMALGGERTNAEYRDALQGVGVDIERLTDLVGTLLTLARADTGGLQIEREQFDLASSISSLLDAYGPHAASAGVTLIDESTPTPVRADEDLVVQVLVNLVDNALGHTPPGGRISVGCAAQDGQACLWVADTGAGIAPEHHARVFERFYRVDTGRTRARGGTGLGLSFCQAIAEAHGGSIRVASEPGRGARFTCCLPAGAA